MVKAGEVSQRNLFVKNITKFDINVEISLEGEAIKISKTIENLSPKEMKDLEFELIPEITMLKPIKAKLKIKLNYIVR